MTDDEKMPTLLSIERVKRNPELLRPTGRHELIDDYCPDCGGSCLVDFGNPPSPTDRKPEEPDALRDYELELRTPEGEA